MRIVEQWSGGSSISQSHYRVIYHDGDYYTGGAGTYEIQIRIENRLPNKPEYRTLSRFEHLKAQQIGAHLILDDKERIERREIRDEFMRKLKRA